jgi:proteasome lid subunit RPN8/RPN11
MIELPRPMFEEIVAHARAELPNEACGVIAGQDGRPVHVYSMRNVEESPALYRFDGQEQINVMREIEGKGWDMLAIFHSHPSTRAYPSLTDREIAQWRDPLSGEEVPAYPGTKYLILSLANEQPVLRAYRFQGGEPIEEDGRIT